MSKTNGTERHINEMKGRVKHSLQEIDDIRDDIDSFAANVLGLAQSLRDMGNERARIAVDYMRSQLDDLKASGTEAVHKAETTVREKPVQSIAIAFAAGVLASLLFNRSNDS
jgi:ElaB/YqjD/DUF883 family membrane-anchored ribosome-binding protein